MTHVNVGCGEDFKPRFIDVDHRWRPGTQPCWDIRRELPLSDTSARGIFTEHFLEHLTPDQCIATLRDLHRILPTPTDARAEAPRVTPAARAGG